MFGNVPRALWSRWCPPDEQGRIELCCRAFLVEDGERRLLLEAGIGACFEPRLSERYGVLEREHVLLHSLAELGLSAEDIDLVVLSHLHFDHAGGLLMPWLEGRPPELAFRRAKFVVGQTAWSRAKQPHVRDRASFLPALITLLAESGRLLLVDDDQERAPALGSRIRLLTSGGHTPGMRLALLEGTRETAIFCADLVPGAAWAHLPITMGYDRFPEQLIDEKRQLYERLGAGAWLLFTHDVQAAAGRLALDASGRYSASDLVESLDRVDLDA